MKRRIAPIFLVALLSNLPAWSAQPTKFTAIETVGGDSFGGGLDVDGATAVIVATGNSPGSAYIFELESGNWVETATLRPVLEPNERWTSGVAISGDTVAVASNYSIHIFERNSGGLDNWGESALITGGLPTLAFDGDTLLTSLLGATMVYERDRGGVDHWGFTTSIFSPSVGIVGAVAIQGDLAAIMYGSVVSLHGRDVGGEDGWGRIKYVQVVERHSFSSVALSGDTLLVGSVISPAGTREGSSYIFERNAGGLDNWGLLRRLDNPNPSPDGGDHMGASVALEGSTALLGAPGHDPSDIFDAGAVHWFERNQGGPNNWGAVEEIVALDATSTARFGTDVEMSGRQALIAAPYDDELAMSAGAAFGVDLAGPTQPECDINLSYLSESLTIDFTVATPDPTTWSVWIAVQGTIFQLWSVKIPVVDPSFSASFPIPGFPSLGHVGMLSVLQDPVVGISCYDVAVVDTGY